MTYVDILHDTSPGPQPPKDSSWHVELQRLFFTSAFQLWVVLPFPSCKMNFKTQAILKCTKKSPKSPWWLEKDHFWDYCLYRHVYTLLGHLPGFPPRYELPFKKVGGSWNASACLRHFQSSKPRRECPKTFGKQVVTWAHFAKLWRWRSFFCSRLLPASSRFRCSYFFPYEPCTLGFRRLKQNSLLGIPLNSSFPKSRLNPFSFFESSAAI